MKSLDLNQMESIEAGYCGLSLGLLGGAMIAAAFIVAPIAAAIWGLCFIGASINAVDACDN